MALAAALVPARAAELARGFAGRDGAVAAVRAGGLSGLPRVERLAALRTALTPAPTAARTPPHPLLQRLARERRG